MSEITVSTITPDMQTLLDKKRSLVKEAKKLLLEYAETCEALGSEYQQQRCEAGADRELAYASEARLIALNLPARLLGMSKK